MSNVTSNSEIFVDASATAGGSPGTAIQLINFTSFKVTDEQKVEIVKAIGRKGGAGFRRTTGGGTIMATETRQDVPQVPWRKWQKENKVFLFYAQDENDGPLETWFSVTISKCDRSMDDEGVHTDEIEFKFLSSIEE